MDGAGKVDRKGLWWKWTAQDCECCAKDAGLPGKNWPQKLGSRSAPSIDWRKVLKRCAWKPLAQHCLALAARGIGYPYRGTILGDLLVLYLGALGENVYALYRLGHARHL